MMQYYVKINADGRPLWGSSAEQPDMTDVVTVEDASEDFLADLFAYQYVDGKWIKDATYTPPPPPKTALEQMQEDLERQAAALQDLILMTMGGE